MQCAHVVRLHARSIYVFSGVGVGLLVLTNVIASVTEVYIDQLGEADDSQLPMGIRRSLQQTNRRPLIAANDTVRIVR